MTCEELQAEYTMLSDGLTAAQNLVTYFNTALMYNWWNRYLQGCIPGMTGNEMEKTQTKSRAEFDKLLAEKPLLAKLIRFYMEEAV